MVSSINNKIRRLSSYKKLRLQKKKTRRHALPPDMPREQPKHDPSHRAGLAQTATIGLDRAWARLKK